MTTGTGVVAAAVVILAVGAMLPLLGRARRQRLRSNDEEVAARSRYNRLGFYVEDPGATADVEAADLLARARERWNTAGALLADARSEKDFTRVRAVAEEGLELVRDANRKQGKPF